MDFFSFLHLLFLLQHISKLNVKINYVDHKDIIENINTLLKVGYSNSDINIIFSHGDNDSVKKFAKRDKVKYLEEFFYLDYAKLDNYDRYLNYSDETGEDEETTVVYVNLDMDKTPYEEATEVKEFSTTMLVNKHFSLNKNFVPNNLVIISSDDSMNEEIKLNRDAYNAFKQMKSDMNKEGLEK